MRELPTAFTERMKHLLGAEFDEYLACYDKAAERAFRVNTDKISVADFLAVDPFGSTPVPYVANGFYLHTDGIGHHPFHHAGAIYVQDSGAMAAVECLTVQPDWWVLDLCAAPGGKSGQIKNKLGPDGLLISNEIIPSRCKILTGNVERLGLTRTATTCLEPAAMAQRFPKTFDCIIVDAPCSGEGMFRKDNPAIEHWSEENVTRCAERQKEILEQAALALRAGGTILYATCTFSLEENEMVVDNFLQKHPTFALVPVPDAVIAHTSDGIAFDGCHCQTISHARRFYPHKSRGEGQFMAVLKDTAPSLPRPTISRTTGKADAVVMDFLKDTLKNIDMSLLGVHKGNAVYAPPSLPLEHCTAFSCGVAIGEVRKNYLLPHHQFFMALGQQFNRRIELSLDDPDLLRYLRGEEIAADCGNGWAVVTVCGCAVGGAKVSGGRAKNHYPKGLREW
ncbi:MAG: hypothetical protein J6R33_03740 [Clostridia bacterium]|nr:hypothetical protein [Clostridia bacterium]